jgi:hypothetical protein
MIIAKKCKAEVVLVSLFKIVAAFNHYKSLPSFIVFFAAG